MSTHTTSKILVIATAGILLFIFSTFFFFHKVGYEAPIPLYTKGQPTIGSPDAKVHVVAFEDPRCNNCIAYHKQEYQRIYKDFIATGLIRYTIYLVAEDPISAMTANLLFCIDEQSTNSFFSYIDAYYNNPPLALTSEEANTILIRLAKETHFGINIDKLLSCNATGRFNSKVVENTSYAKAIMGGVLKTPTVFVNGVRLVRPTYSQLSKLIQYEMKKSDK